MFTLKVRHVKVGINTGSVDHIWLELDVETAFPKMGYSTTAKLEAEAGYGIEWVRNVLGYEPEVIDFRRDRT